MSERKIFKCNECSNLLELVHEECTSPDCSIKGFTLIEANTVDAAQEKHVPFIEKIPGGYRVSVGTTLHPMEDKHSILWIELIAGDRTMRQYLKPGQTPVAEFQCDADKVIAREYCNLHGLWKANN